MLRRVFTAWWIRVPRSFSETFVHEDGYWHSYDEHRSISLTSFVLDDGEGPVPAEEIFRVATQALRGTPVNELPPGLLGRAVTARAPRSSRASKLLSGVAAADGNLLLATVTSDDLEWARKVWVSIRHRPPDRSKPGKQGTG